MVRATSAFACAFVGILAATVSVHAAHEMVFFTALDGKQQAPAPVVTNSIGAAYLIYDDRAMTLKVTVATTIANVAAAHIHSGAPGTAGPVLLTLSNGTTNAIFMANFTAVTAEVAQAIMTGNAYVNVHTAANPNGEIRGDLLVKNSFNGLNSTRFMNAYAGMLSGAAEVPPVTTASTGFGFVQYDPTTMMASILIETNIANITASHIHSGAVTASGPVLVTISGAADRVINATIAIDAATLTAIQSGNAYLNVHTAANPGGEIRAQLMPFATLLGLPYPAGTSSSMAPSATGTGTATGTAAATGTASVAPTTTSRPASAGRNAIGAAGLFVAAAVMVLA